MFNIRKYIPFLFLFVLCIPFFSRFGLYLVKDIEFANLIFFRGFVADMLLASTVYFFLLFTGRFFRFLYVFLIVAFIVVFVANTEHISAMNASISLVCLFRFQCASYKETFVFQRYISGALIVLSATFMFFFPVQFNDSQWKQSNVVSENISRVIALSFSQANRPLKSREADRVLAEINKTDLSGPLRYKGTKKNILLIMLEGISGHHVFHPNDQKMWLDDTFMPELAEASNKAVSYTHFIAPQVQTNRGEYALLCGDLPNLATGAAKMSITDHILKAKKFSCLPKMLKDNGYATSYLQASGMEFMNKNTFMPTAGFETSYGTRWFEKPYFRHPWGVGDFDFFKQSYKEVERLESTGKPWFLSMLTVGTHHSYKMPEKFVNKDLSPYANAVAHADQQVMAFIRDLDSKGILDNTLVIVTSDESQGTKKDSTLLTKNWIPFVVFDKVLRKFQKPLRKLILVYLF